MQQPGQCSVAVHMMGKGAAASAAGGRPSATECLACRLGWVSSLWQRGIASILSCFTSLLVSCKGAMAACRNFGALGERAGSAGAMLAATSGRAQSESPARGFLPPPHARRLPATRPPPACRRHRLPLLQAMTSCHWCWPSCAPSTWQLQSAHAAAGGTCPLPTACGRRTLSQSRRLGRQLLCRRLRRHSSSSSRGNIASSIARQASGSCVTVHAAAPLHAAHLPPCDTRRPASPAVLAVQWDAALSSPNGYIRTVRVEREAHGSAPLAAVSAAPCGTLLLSASADGALCLWEIATPAAAAGSDAAPPLRPRLLCRTQHPGPLAWAQLAAPETALSAGGAAACVWRVEQPRQGQQEQSPQLRLVRHVTVEGGGVLCAAAFDMHLACGCSDGAVRVLDVGSGTCTKLLRLHRAGVTALQHVQRGDLDLLVRCGSRGRLRGSRPAGRATSQGPFCFAPAGDASAAAGPPRPAPAAAAATAACCSPTPTAL